MTEPYSDLWPSTPAAEERPELVLNVRVLEGDLQRLRLRRGDKLVLMTDRVLTENEQVHIMHEHKRSFPDHELIVLPPGFRLGVIAASD
jgi:hypothetical protein